GMFQHEMAIEEDGLNLSQKRIITVDVRPTRLDHANIFTGEVMNGALKKIRRWNEISVKDRDVLSGRSLHSLVKRAGFEPGAIRAIVIRNRVSLSRVMLD